MSVKLLQPYTTFIHPLRQAKCVNLYQPRHTLESLRTALSVYYLPCAMEYRGPVNSTKLLTSRSALSNSYVTLLIPPPSNSALCSHGRQKMKLLLIH